MVVDYALNWCGWVNGRVDSDSDSDSALNAFGDWERGESSLSGSDRDGKGEELPSACSKIFTASVCVVSDDGWLLDDDDDKKVRKKRDVFVLPLERERCRE